MSTIPLNSSTAKLEDGVPSVPSSSSAVGDLNAGKSSYGQILKSTALVGGSQVINIAIGIVRTKAIAMLLGPAGFGLAGLYMSVAQLTQSVAGMGVNSSGVRQIAEAVGTGDDEKIARTAIVLRRTSWALGLLGAAVLLLFAAPIARITFGNYDRTSGVVILAAAVFLNLVSAGQGALLQGTRRIADLAKMSVLGALFGTIATIPLVYFFREQGVVPSLVAVAAVTLLASWWYSRRIEVRRIHVTSTQVRAEASGLLKLGVAFMVSGLMTMGSAYVIRIIIANKLGLAATGLYQAAWTLGGLYVGMILQAMGADFYPRLSAAAHDNAECNRLVNEQVRVSMLLAAPGILATLTFAPLIMSIFYAPAFKEAVAVLRWICLGIAMRVICWPMGYALAAKGSKVLFLSCDTTWTLIHLTLGWFFLRMLGLSGVGAAFFAAYLVLIILNYASLKHLTAFCADSETRSTAGFYAASIVSTFAVTTTLPAGAAFTLGSLTTFITLVYTCTRVHSAVDLEFSTHLPLICKVRAIIAGISRFLRGLVRKEAPLDLS